MTYAEAMNRVEVWFRYWDSPLVDRKKQDAEALAVLRQAVPLMEAAGLLCEIDRRGRFEPVGPDCKCLYCSRVRALLAAIPEAKDGPK